MQAYGTPGLVPRGRSADPPPTAKDDNSKNQVFLFAFWTWRCVRGKGPGVAKGEVDDGAAEDGDDVRDEHRQVCGVDKEAHEGEVSDERDHAVGGVEAEELREDWAVVAAVAPGVVDVPDEVVQDGELDRCGGGDEVVAGGEVVEEGEGGELQHHAHRSDEAELEPAEERAHGSGSCW